MAVLNEIIWRTQTTDFLGVAFSRRFGVISAGRLAFAISQMPLTKRYHLEAGPSLEGEAMAGMRGMSGKG